MCKVSQFNRIFCSKSRPSRSPVWFGHGPPNPKSRGCHPRFVRRVFWSFRATRFSNRKPNRFSRTNWSPSGRDWCDRTLLPYSPKGRCDGSYATLRQSRRTRQNGFLLGWCACNYKSSKLSHQNIFINWHLLVIRFGTPHMSGRVDQPGGVQAQDISEDVQAVSIFKGFVPENHRNHRRKNEAHKRHQKQEVFVLQSITPPVLISFHNPFRTTYLNSGSAYKSERSIPLPFRLTSSCFLHINQPMCEKKKPRLALCGSASVSWNLWCTRWSLDHSITEFYIYKLFYSQTGYSPKKIPGEPKFDRAPKSTWAAILLCRLGEPKVDERHRLFRTHLTDTTKTLQEREKNN